MRLKRLVLRNFQGCREFVLEPNGEDVTVFGRNATGKTTLFNAWTWLLFGKDSLGQASFEIKTLKPDGTPHHGLEHEVEAVLILDDGREVKLKKVYKEKWTKRRGSAHREFSGHVTHHYINDVPCKKTEYDAYIQSIAAEDYFRLLTDPLFFNTQLHWTERRRLLLEVCGDISDQEVIESNEKLARLSEILERHSLDDYRKIIRERRKKINDELEKIPVRIDEVRRSLPNLPEDDIASFESRLDEARQYRQMFERALVKLSAGGAIAEKEKKLAELETERLRLLHAIEAKAHEATAEERERLRAAQEELTMLESSLGKLRRSKEELEGELDQNEKRRERLRGEWLDINAAEFGEPPPANDDINASCPACGQPMPEERIEEARTAAMSAYQQRLAEFNERKAKMLEAVATEGRSLKSRAESLVAEIEQIDKEIAAIEAAVQEKTAHVEKLYEALQAAQSEKPDPMTVAEYREIMAKIEKAKQDIAELKQGNAKEIQQLREEIDVADKEIRKLEEALGLFKQHERAEARVKELKAEERRLAKELEGLEEGLFLTEQFIRTKVRLLEEKINSRFKIARFKLFRELVNEGLEEVCEVMVGGVPYASLNNGARINAGLDIINVLSEHFAFHPPVWMDNAESITEIMPTKGQQIKLVVSAEDDALRVETANREAV